MQNCIRDKRTLRKKLRLIQKTAYEKGLDRVLLQQFNFICNYKLETANKGTNRRLILAIVTGFVVLVISVSFVNSIISERCILPSNYLVWEATRPLADCAYCANVTKPIILQNITRRDFATYAYSSRPIIVKNAIRSWRATRAFSFNMFRRLYEQTSGSYESLDEGCQFLNFKTDLFTLKEVFNMPIARVKNDPGQKPWYVGCISLTGTLSWCEGIENFNNLSVIDQINCSLTGLDTHICDAGTFTVMQAFSFILKGNCHPDILAKVRQYYKIPDFLPEDAEFPATENIFFGYEMGAVMHLDYIPRLMWQGQVRGNKTWSLVPVPECDHFCHKFEYYVEPGDVVLLDTRVWYHATRIPKGQFSITVQSEYG